jgi:hypothetical protein
MKCKDCPYHYKTEEDLFPCCHCDMPEGWAPCEQEEDYDTEDTDDEYYDRGEEEND